MAPLSSPLGVRQERSPGVRQCNEAGAARKALGAVRKKDAPGAARKALGAGPGAPEAVREVLGPARKKDASAQTVPEAERLKPEQMGTAPVQSHLLKLKGLQAQRCRQMTRSSLYLQGSCRLWHRLLPVYSWSTAIRPTISTGRSSRDRGTNPAADLSWRDPSYTSPFIER